MCIYCIYWFHILYLLTKVQKSTDLCLFTLRDFFYVCVVGAPGPTSWANRELQAYNENDKKPGSL